MTCFHNRADCGGVGHGPVEYRTTRYYTLSYSSGWKRLLLNPLINRLRYRWLHRALFGRSRKVCMRCYLLAEHGLVHRGDGSFIHLHDIPEEDWIGEPSDD